MEQHGYAGENAQKIETNNKDGSSERYYPPIFPGKTRPRRYTRREYVGERIVRALARGLTTNDVIIEVKDRHARSLRKQNVQYWKDIALDKGMIIPCSTEGRSIQYCRGPNYHLVEMFPGRWQNKDSRPITCRVHCSAGSAISVEVKKPVWEDIKVVDSNGQVQTLKFELKRVRKHLESTFSVLIPFELVGYHGAYATINYADSDYGSNLYISPPEVRLTGDQLTGKVPPVVADLEALDLDGWAAGHEDDPFTGAVAYCCDLMEENEWKLGGWRNNKDFHYAFDEEIVKNYYPALLESVPQLRGPDETPQSDLWIDRSHGQRELETNDLGVAIEIDNLLNFTRKRVTGERSYRGWSKK
jgi:hypothetical protein